MTISLNHTLVHSKDPHHTAAFLTDILGLPAPSQLAHFTQVHVGVTMLDLIQTDEPISSLHFAFLVSESEFDAIFERIRARALPYWADPFHGQPSAINHWDDGRGLYFDDPDGHLLEVITKSYGSGGLTAKHPNPLLLRT
jgi:catechol 2,3-dioxygenase-like lactoylglutathione lyase family enzyme